MAGPDPAAPAPELAAIAPLELAQRVAPHAAWRGSALSGDQLARWLVHERLADVDQTGQLVPTARAIEVGSGIAW